MGTKFSYDEQKKLFLFVSHTDTTNSHDIWSNLGNKGAYDKQINNVRQIQTNRKKKQN